MSDLCWVIEERDTGNICAKGYASVESDARREMEHYALQYVQDGPVRCTLRRGRKTLMTRMYELAGGSE
jgi:hypothetical protein